jgi:hypothetical protein
MIRFEHPLAPSETTCLSCNHPLTAQELEEFNGSIDECLQGSMYCRGCAEQHLVVCRECSGRYTVDGICEECTAREYALAG